jgi:hypothetical protein
MRAITSDKPPAGYGTNSVTGLTDWAAAPPASKAPAAQAMARVMRARRPDFREDWMVM